MDEQQFSIDNIVPVIPPDYEPKSYFTIKLTFPSDKKNKIVKWMKKHKTELQEEIMKRCDSDE